MCTQVFVVAFIGRTSLPHTCTTIVPVFDIEFLVPFKENITFTKFWLVMKCSVLDARLQHATEQNGTFHKFPVPCVKIPFWGWECLKRSFSA